MDLYNEYISDAFRTALEQKDVPEITRLSSKVKIDMHTFDIISYDCQLIQCLEDKIIGDRRLLNQLMQHCIKTGKIDVINCIISWKSDELARHEIFSHAIRSKDLEITKLVANCLDNTGYNTGFLDYEYWTTRWIDAALDTNTLEIVKFVFESISHRFASSRPKKINYQFTHSQLKKAITNGNLDLTKFVLDHSNLIVDTETVCLAITSRNIDLLVLVIGVTLENSTACALRALKSGTVEMLRYFLRLPNELKMINKTVANCLLASVSEERVPKLQLLLDHGIHLTPEGKSLLETDGTMVNFFQTLKNPITVFREAVISGDLNAIKACVQSGVDVHLYDDFALDFALTNRNVELIKYFLSIE